MLPADVTVNSPKKELQTKMLVTHKMEEDMTDPVELTKTLVKIESCNPGKGEGEIGEYLFLRLTRRGIPVRRQEVFPGRFNLIAEIKGKTDMPPLVIICHMDTVVIGEGWTKAPFAAEEENGRIFGRGACDMKSGFSCALAVLEETWESGEKPERTLLFVATVDEEAEMNGIQAILKEKLVPPESMLLDMEPTSLAVTTSHKGRIWYHVCIRGVTAHASTPWKGIDAIAAAAEFISSVRELILNMPEHPEMGPNTVTFGQIAGGYQPYVVPDICKVTMDIRTVSPYNESDIETLMLRAKRNTELKFSGIDISWELTGNRPCVYGDSKSELCSAICEAFREECGRDTSVGLFPGYTDTAVAAVELEDRNCVSFGPGALVMAHKPDEYVETKEIEICKRVLEKAVKKLCF